jgi:tRNA (mo5U34)-methyltransferase
MILRECRRTTRSAEIDALGPWFHNLHLPDGRRTMPDHPLGDFPAYKWAEIAPHLPDDLSGWSVLDVGCNAGFYSFEVARRGATVLGIDVSDHYLGQARWAARVFGLEGRVRFDRRAVYELIHEPGQYDLVLFMGVFYHLRYPLLGLDVAAEKARRLLVFQSLTMPDEETDPRPRDLDLASRKRLTEPGWPRLAFIETTFCQDPTNWWVPNHAAIVSLLRASGLEVVARPGHEIYLCRPDRGQGQERDRREGLGAAGLLAREAS